MSSSDLSFIRSSDPDDAENGFLSGMGSNRTGVVFKISRRSADVDRRRITIWGGFSASDSELVKRRLTSRFFTSRFLFPRLRFGLRELCDETDEPDDDDDEGRRLRPRVTLSDSSRD